MKPYQSLKTLCAVWLFLTMFVGLALAAVGIIQVIRGDLSSILYIMIAVFTILAVYTFSELVDLLIDIAIALTSRRVDLPAPQLTRKPKD